jgi:hypothetical protein
MENRMRGYPVTCLVNADPLISVTFYSETDPKEPTFKFSKESKRALGLEAEGARLTPVGLPQRPRKPKKAA